MCKNHQLDLVKEFKCLKIKSSSLQAMETNLPEKGL